MRKGGGRIVGLTCSDNTLFGKEDLAACLNRGAACGLLNIRPLSYVPGDACCRGTAFGLSEPVRLKFRQNKKVARCNWRSNLPRSLALMHDRGMKRHKTEKAKGEHETQM